MGQIDQEKLKELSRLVCGATHYEGYQCHICERREMARELLALRQREERLQKALEWALDLLDMYDKRLAQIDPPEMVYAPIHLAGKKKARAALAKGEKE